MAQIDGVPLGCGGRGVPSTILVWIGHTPALQHPPWSFT